MKRLTYVTVIVLGQPRRTNAHKVDGAEGTTWARGWHTPAAKALKVAQALA